MFPTYHGTLETFDLVPRWFSVGLQSDFLGIGWLSPCAGDILAVPFAVVSFGAQKRATGWCACWEYGLWTTNLLTR
ncbi:hypothetical protein BDV33DRAFT_165701 [Aspergillus novoparasiticus]|uniref:Uncharacterized protein n=1 Tax=Aspergillus novoparasiticus TaxID=986946 RepID=A0A5N6F569_9EURO|nr:hypothetical protein BDV33DRAFT_165701 [Aspergillus novoparasiticus]